MVQLSRTPNFRNEIVPQFMWLRYPCRKPPHPHHDFPSLPPRLTRTETLFECAQPHFHYTQFLPHAPAYIPPIDSTLDPNSSTTCYSSFVEPLVQNVSINKIRLEILPFLNPTATTISPPNHVFRGHVEQIQPTLRRVVQTFKIFNHGQPQ